MAASLGPPRVVNIDDLRRAARRRLPRVVFDYIDGGADAEVTLRENCRAFDDVTFRPRSAVATPTLRPPHHRARHDARVCRSSSRRSAAAACSIRAARKWPRAPPARPARSTSCRRCPAAASRTSRRATRGPVWYQLYLIGGRDVALAAIARARAVAAAPRSSSPSTRPSPACASATCATASKELRVGRAWSRCCRTSASSWRGRAGSPRTCATAA